MDADGYPETMEELHAMPTIGVMRGPTIAESKEMLLELLGRRAVMRPIDRDDG